VRDHAVRLKMCKLDRKRFKRMSFRHIVLNSVLELLSSKRTAPNPLILVVSQRS
jgi:hypothetical protein